MISADQITCMYHRDDFEQRFTALVSLWNLSGDEVADRRRIMGCFIIADDVVILSRALRSPL